MELLAPAGGMEQLECAIHFGADAVYLAGKRFGMRRRATNFDDAGIAKAVDFAHKHGAKVYVTANTLMKDADIAALPDYFAMLQDAGVDAAIVSDMGALALCKRVAPKLDLHLSTQASCMNAEAAKAYYDLGVSRVVVAREMSLADIARMRENIPDDLEIEAFVHGAMCMAYSGRCLMSDYMAGPKRGANNGHCAQPCRWKYTLVEETRPDEPFTVVEDDGGSFIMSSTDMNMLSHLRELSEAGVDSIKIEGRAKGAYYVASAVNAYRHVLDGQDAAAWQAELETTSHRPYSTGFYFGAPGQNQGKKEYARDYQMVARVVATASQPAEAWPADGLAKRREKIAADPYAEKKGCVSVDFIDGLAASPAQPHRVRVACRNRFFEGEALEVLSSGRDVFTIRPTRIVWHAGPDADPDDAEKRREGAIAGADPQVIGGTLCTMNVANRTMEEYSFDCDAELHEGDILRVLRSDQCEGRTIG